MENKQTVKNPESKKKSGALQRNFDEIEIFLDHLKKKRYVQPNTIGVYEHYEHKMLEWAGNRYFSNAAKIKPTFPEYLDKLRKEDGSEYDQDYINGACSFARRFFEYAYKRFDYYSKRLPADFFDDFKPIMKTTDLEKLDFYTEEDMLKIAALIPKSIIDLRNIAAFIFIYLSGMRITAFLSMPIYSVNLEDGIVVQNPSDGTYTKLNKAGRTVLLDNPILLEVVKRWDMLVRQYCPPESTWYARMNNKQQFNPKVIELRDRRDPNTFKEAHGNYKNFTMAMKDICKRAGVKYRSPHKGRYGNIHKWMENITTMEERQALAENSLHTLPVLERTYTRMTNSEANSVMKRIASKEKKKSLPKPGFAPEKRDNNGLPFDFYSLPECVQQTIIMIANNVS